MAKDESTLFIDYAIKYPLNVSEYGYKYIHAHLAVTLRGGLPLPVVVLNSDQWIFLFGTFTCA